jgi:DNA polymerase-3 subunit chi
VPQLDFHFNVPERVEYACRVVRKARAAGKTVVAWTADAERLARFDAALWTFSALDFLPHVYADNPLAAETPVLLALDAARLPQADVLLLLDDAPPPAHAALFARYERVIDVVSRDEAERDAARLRFKAYRDEGLEPTAHDQATR